MNPLSCLRALAISLLACFAADAKESDALRLVEFATFMQGSVEPDIPITIPVPEEFVPLDLDDSPNDYSYWMRKADRKRSIRTGDLPGDHGYMYGKLSTDVGYDADSDVFMGAEDAASVAAGSSQFSEFTLQRLDHPRHPALLVTLVDPHAGTRAFAMYVSTGIATNVVYIAFRPKHNRRDLGERWLTALRKGLIESNYVVKLVPDR